MATAEERALSALTKVNNIGFPEFTAKLIGDTVEAVVGATVRQLKSYAELVSELEAGLEAFKAKVVTTESVAQYMRDAFPGEAGETAVQAGQPYDHGMYQQIVTRLGSIDGLADPGENETAIFTEEQVNGIRTAVQNALGRTAEASFEQLRMLVQMGYARVIFTNGRIKSKLTFDVTSTDMHQRDSSDIAQSAFQASLSAGGIFGRIFGISGSMSYRSIHVRTVNERNLESDRVTGDIMGEVEVNFAR